RALAVGPRLRFRHYSSRTTSGVPHFVPRACALTASPDTVLSVPGWLRLGVSNCRFVSAAAAQVHRSVIRLSLCNDGQIGQLGGRAPPTAVDKRPPVVATSGFGGLRTCADYPPSSSATRMTQPGRRPPKGVYRVGTPNWGIGRAGDSPV